MSGKTQIFGDQIVSGTITNTQISATATISSSKITPPGSTTQLIFNNAGAFAADSDLTWNAATATLTILGTAVSTSPTVNLGSSGASGTLQLQNQSGVRFFELASNGVTNVLIQGPNTVTSSYLLRLPPTQGAANTTILNDGSGNLSFAAALMANGVNAMTASLNAAGQQINNFGALTSFPSGTIQLFDSVSNKVTLQAPTTITSNYTLKFPTAQGGAGTALTNDGSGNLSWATGGTGSVTQNTYTVGTPSGSYTGSTTLFNLPFTYVQDGKSLQVMYNGQILVSGVDYSETSNTSVTFTNALTSGFTAVFRYITPQTPSNTSVAQYANFVIGTSSGTYTGSTTVYNLPFAYTQDAKSLAIFYDGVQLVPGDDYTETTSTSITTTQALVSGQKIAFRTISTIGTSAAVTALRENYVVGTPSGNYTGSTTVFNLINSYTPGGINLQMFIDGDLQTIGAGNDYVETNSTTVTSNFTLTAGQSVTFLFSQTVAATGTVTTGSANTLAAYNSAGSVIASMGANASAGGFKVTNVANGTSAADAVNLSQLKVLQVGIPVFNSTTTNSTTATWADTSLTASITPSSTSSRILVIVSQQGYVAVNVGNTILDLRIVQGASTVVQTFPCVLSGPTTGSQTGAITSQLFIAAIDSPATTSAVSYKTQLQNQNAASTAATNRTTGGTQPTSMILLIEVV